MSPGMSTLKLTAGQATLVLMREAGVFSAAIWYALPSRWLPATVSVTVADVPSSVNVTVEVRRFCSQRLVADGVSVTVCGGLFAGTAPRDARALAPRSA